MVAGLRYIRNFSKIFFALQAMLAGNTAVAQTAVCLNRQITTFNFTTSSLESGTAGTVGAVYRFTNVATGVDARVQILAMSAPGILANIDNNTGLANNFQPELGGTNARSIDFNITFVAAGTASPLTVDLAATAIDIDGDSNAIREYAKFSNAYAVFALNNPTLVALNASGPSAAGRARFEATTAANAPGIDPTA